MQYFRNTSIIQIPNLVDAKLRICIPVINLFMFTSYNFTTVDEASSVVLSI